MVPAQKAVSESSANLLFQIASGGEKTKSGWQNVKANLTAHSSRKPGFWLQVSRKMLVSSTTTLQKLFVVLYTLFSFIAICWVDDSLHKTVNEIVGGSLLSDLQSFAEHARECLQKFGSFQ